MIRLPLNIMPVAWVLLVQYAALAHLPQVCHEAAGVVADGLQAAAWQAGEDAVCQANHSTISWHKAANVGQVHNQCNLLAQRQREVTCTGWGLNLS